eukprot:sb/3476617/
MATCHLLFLNFSKIGRAQIFTICALDNSLTFGCLVWRYMIESVDDFVLGVERLHWVAIPEQQRSITPENRRFLGYRFIQDRPILLKFEYNKWQVAIFLFLKFQSKIFTTFDAMSI